MYGIEILTSSLVAIDKTTGAGSTIGALGYSTRFGQGLDFNAATGVMYLASIDYGAGGVQNMYTVDLGSGLASLVGPIGNNIIQLGSFAIAVPSGPCGQPADQPWLSLNPTSGTTAPAGDTPVTVGINAAGFNDGDVLSGTVCVRSNDPDEHTVAVPVEYTVGPGGDPNVVDSGVINVAVPNNVDGFYINWLTGCTATSSGGCTGGTSFNPYNSGTGLAFFWPSTGGANRAGVLNGTDLAVLASGATVGPASTWGTSTGSVAWRAGADAYIGFRFDNGAVVNYGYAHFTSTGATGFPATLVEYWYNSAGAAISIP
jgi:hypothetical protein